MRLVDWLIIYSRVRKKTKKTDLEFILGKYLNVQNFAVYYFQAWIAYV